MLKSVCSEQAALICLYYFDGGEEGRMINSKRRNWRRHRAREDRCALKVKRVYLRPRPGERRRSNDFQPYGLLLAGGHLAAFGYS